MTEPKAASVERTPPELDPSPPSNDAAGELTARERLLCAAFEGALDAIIVTDRVGACVVSNAAASALFGVEPAGMIGRTLGELGVATGALRLPTCEASSSSGQRRGHVSLLRANGARLELEYGSTADVLPGMHLWVFRDVTEQRRADASLLSSERKYRQLVDTEDTAHRRTGDALRASEEQYRLLFECSPLPKWLTDVASTRFLAANTAACLLWGYSKEELLELTIADIFTAEDLASMKQAAASTPPSQPIRGTWRTLRKDGASLEVDVHGLTFDLDGRAVRLVVGQDVTHAKRLEAQLIQAQKLEAVGLLAGGIAHDFNNLLSVVATYCSFMLDALKPGDPLRDDVSEISKASARAMALTAQLLAFSRQQILAPRLMDLNETVSGVRNMLQRLLGDDIELSFVSGRSLGRVHADPGQIEQVIMNLVVNARDAMPDGGALTIETKNVQLDADYAAQHPGVGPGSYVMLAVTDTGIGMDTQTRGRIFEPFFTTKASGKGTGLGLPTVLGITQQSGGNLEVMSEPGRGSTFKIHLPHVDGVVAKNESVPPPAVTSRGNETILVVDDDDQVRQLVRAILGRKGYRVIDARNGGEAFLICEQQPEHIDLLLTDMVMPRMSGPQLAQRLLPMRPGMKVLFMSGYTPERWARDDVAVLPKPITPDTLSRRVREVLGDVRA